MDFQSEYGFWILKNGKCIKNPIEDDEYELEHFQAVLQKPETFGLSKEWAEELVESYGYDDVERAIIEMDREVADEVLNNAIEKGNIRVRVFHFVQKYDVFFTVWNYKRDNKRVLDFILDNYSELQSNTFSIGEACKGAWDGMYSDILEFKDIDSFIEFLNN